MATDKNKKNKMDANSSEDTTSQLAVLPPNARYIDEEAEADANTYAFDGEESDDQSPEELRSNLKSRDEYIDKLQFDAEQLRARVNGLEKENAAREELTQILQQDLRIAHKERVAKDKLLQNNDRKIKELDTRIDQFAPQADSSQLGNEVDSYKTEIVSMDKQLAELATEAQTKQRSLSTAENEIERLQDRLGKERSKTKKLRKQNGALKRDVDAMQSDSEFDIGQRLAEQSGQLVSNRDEIVELKNQILRSERYADGLREGLNNLEIATTDSDAKRQQLADSLEQATSQLRELREQLDAERFSNTELVTTNSELKKQFKNEVNQIRFELGTAQQTLGDYESANEKLTSNLVDNTHYREALEDQLSVAEEQRANETSGLEKKVNRLQKQLDESGRKISNKDAALSALLSELASKSQAIESVGDKVDIGDVSGVIREIENTPSGRHGDGVSQERERPTRLLIGMVGDKELQFPLFKDRLTIGRTRQNDIQLKAQFVSRRHAVILSDEDGPRIIDWGSRNGVFVNDLKVSEQRLCSGDKVTIGNADFVFEERQKR